MTEDEKISGDIEISGDWKLHDVDGDGVPDYVTFKLRYLYLGACVITGLAFEYLL